MNDLLAPKIAITIISTISISNFFVMSIKLFSLPGEVQMNCYSKNYDLEEMLESDDGVDQK